jgi:hypothetical protein
MKIKSFTEFSTPVVKEDETITKKIVYRNEDDKDDEAVPFENEVTEEDGAEEIQMAMGELERIGDYADMIMDKIKGMPDLEAWVQSKITKAKDYVTTVHDYLDGVDGIKESVNEAGKLKVGKEDFSFLLKLTDKELVKRLDLIRKQQLINGKQYMTARSKGEDTSKIEKVGENLANQERAVIQARIRLHDIRNTASESVNEKVIQGKDAGNLVKGAGAGKTLKIDDDVYTSLGKGKWKGPNDEKLNWIEVASMVSALGNKEVVYEGVEDLNESTRWQVGTIDNKGNIESAYVHYDGYPENVKPLLTKHYTDKKKIADLMKLAKVAGVSYLAPELGAGKQNFNDPDAKTSLFYGRDRGEKGKSATLKGDASNIEDYIRHASNDGSADYVYLYDERDGKWYYASYKDKSLKTL